MAHFRKDTVVRITDESWNLIGETFRVTGKQRTVKGVKQMELQSLETHGRITFATPEQVTPSVQLTPEQHEHLTARQIEIKEQHERARKEFEEREAQKQAEARQQALKEDAVWNASSPVENTARRYGDETRLTTEIRVVGPMYEGRDGKEHQRDLTVDVTIERGHWSFGKDFIYRTVNWSAIGSSSPATARAYARALLAAADLAEQLDLPAA